MSSKEINGMQVMLNWIKPRCRKVKAISITADTQVRCLDLCRAWVKRYGGTAKGGFWRECKRHCAEIGGEVIWMTSTYLSAPQIQLDSEHLEWINGV